MSLIAEGRTGGELMPIHLEGVSMESAHRAQLATTRRQMRRAYTETQELVDEAHHEERGLVVDPNEPPDAPVSCLDAHMPTDMERIEFRQAQEILEILTGVSAVVSIILAVIAVWHQQPGMAIASCVGAVCSAVLCWRLLSLRP